MGHLEVIAGSDAGTSAALRAREIDPKIEVKLLCADRFPNFSICGLPFFLSSEVRDWRTLAHRNVEELEGKGIRLLLEHRAETIDPVRKTVSAKSSDGNAHLLKYDRLAVCTGAVSVSPRIDGIGLPGVFPLRWMADGFALKEFLEKKQPKDAVIVGGGYIGMEMADAFRYRGMNVTVVEFADTVLTTLDPELGRTVEQTLSEHGVTVKTRSPVSAIEREDGRLLVTGGNELRIKTDLVLFAVGVRPETALAASAGVRIGERGAIRVNRRMETSIKDIHAAGDCVETWHHLLEKNVYMPLGTTAHKQGLAAGENAAGGNREYQGSLGTQVVKIFDLVAARTGLRDHEAKEAGFDPLTVEFEGWDHKAYYPGAQKLTIRMTGDRSTGRLLGVQMIGHRNSEISKRVDVIAAALFKGMDVSELPDLDLSYTPPLGSPWDPIQTTAQEWMKQKTK
jgi:NADPH-dependent 2,4-dienoyl-CoA reductase/sulfur reductase-like enzyme